MVALSSLRMMTPSVILLVLLLLFLLTRNFAFELALSSFFSLEQSETTSFSNDRARAADFCSSVATARMSDSESVSFVEVLVFVVRLNSGGSVIWTFGAPHRNVECASGSLSDSLRTVVKLICGCAESGGSPGTVGGWEMVIIEEVDAGLFDGEVSDHLWFKISDVCWEYKQRKRICGCDERRVSPSA